MNKWLAEFKQISPKEFAKDIIYDIIGTSLFAIGYYTFAEKGGFAPGGVTGISLMIRQFIDIPLGTLILILNIPIIIGSFPFLTKRFYLNSMRTMLISTFIMDVIFARLPVYDGDPLLAAVFTGVFGGAGLGIVYMRGSSTGGVDFLLAAIKKKSPHLSFGQITLIIDGVVILMGAVVFGGINAVLYGLISVFAGTFVMDKLMYGAAAGKLVIVVTDYGDDIAKAISDSVERGSTVTPATGTYTGNKKDMLYCACANRDVYPIRRAIYSVDKNAIIMICEASEVFGEGFARAERDH